MERALQDQRKRARSWLLEEDGSSAGGSAAGWKCRKRHRVASAECLMEIENMLRSSSFGDLGLQRFEVDADATKRGTAFEWPSLTLARDSGPDMQCPLSYLLRHLRLNVDDIPETSHSGWRSVIAALKTAGLWGHMQVQMTVSNVPHGAWKDDMRYRQALQLLEEKLKCENPFSDVLFQEMLGDMIDDLGLQNTMSQEAVTEHVWATLLEDGPWRRKGCFLTKNRFLGAIADAVKEEVNWSMREYTYTSVCLELDMFKNGKLHKVASEVDKGASTAASSSSAAPAAAARRTTAPTEESRLLKTVCQNAMALAAMFYGNKTNRSYTRIVAYVCQGALDWHADQNRRLRSTGETLKWCVEQIKGGFFDHLRSTITVMSDEVKLARINIRCAYVPARDGPVVQDMHGDVVVENEYAEKMGDLVLALLCQRLKRFMWLLRGWLARTCLMATGCNSPAAMEEVMVDFRRDYDEFARFKAQNLPHSAEKLRRSIFALNCVEQAYTAAREEGFRVSRKLQQFYAEKNSRNIATQAVEDAFNRQRRKEELSKNKQGRPQVLYQKLISSRILGEVHDYIDASTDERVISRGTPFPASAFHPTGGMWGKLREIIGYNRTSEWWTSTPENQCVPYLDLEFIHFVLTNGKERHLQYSWMSCLLEGQRMLVRETRSDKWFFNLGEVATTAALGWPAKLVRDESMKQDYFVPSTEVTSLKDLKFLVVLDNTTYEGMLFDWVCPLSVWRGSMQTRRHRDFAQVLAKPSTKPISLLECAAREGFWHMTKQVLERLSDLEGIEKTPARTTFDLTFALAKKCTSASDEQVMEWLMHRVVKTQAKTVISAEDLAQMEEISDQLDKDAQNDLKTEQKERKARKQESDNFHAEWKSKRASITSGGSGSRKSRQGGNRDNEPQRKYPKAISTNLKVLQSQVRNLCPPKGYIWRGNTTNSWNCHFAPWPRKSIPTKVWGEQTAIRFCLQWLWACYNMNIARPAHECPIEGIFDGTLYGNLPCAVVSAGATSNAASSST